MKDGTSSLTKIWLLSPQWSFDEPNHSSNRVEHWDVVQLPMIKSV